MPLRVKLYQKSVVVHYHPKVSSKKNIVYTVITKGAEINRLEVDLQVQGLIRWTECPREMFVLARLSGPWHSCFGVGQFI